jgi:hypothetical protein
MCTKLPATVLENRGNSVLRRPITYCIHQSYGVWRSTQESWNLGLWPKVRMHKPRDEFSICQSNHYYDKKWLAGILNKYWYYMGLNSAFIYDSELWRRGGGGVSAKHNSNLSSNCTIKTCHWRTGTLRTRYIKEEFTNEDREIPKTFRKYRPRSWARHQIWIERKTQIPEQQ